MKHLTIKKLQDRFVGKVCTILTSTIAKTNFNDHQFSEFFTGIVESLDEDGVFTTHAITKCFSFFTWTQIIGIQEEQVISQEDPRYEQVLKEYEKIQEKPVQNSESPYWNPENLEFLNQKTMVKKS